MLRSRAFLLLATLLSASPVSAFHQLTPTLVQITPNSGPGSIGSQHWAGIRYVIFDSDADLVHTGSTGRQIFLFDLLERDLRGLPGVEQLTFGPGVPSHGTTGKLANEIVYETQPFPGGPRQLFYFDRRSGFRYPLTNGPASSYNPRMDASSRMVVFESDADFFNTAIPGTQIYRIDLRKLSRSCPFPCALSANRGLVQITRAAGTSRNAVTSSGGKHVAFESDADLLGIGEHTTQVYTYDVKRDVMILHGRGPGESRRPSLSQNGAWLAFESDTDLLGTGTMGTQIYVRKKDSADFQQITDRPIGHCSAPSLSSNGHAVSFVSSDDLLSTGSTGPEVFSFDLHQRVLQQLTDGPSTASASAYAGGVFVTFVSDGDLLGTGTVGGALYLINLFAFDGTPLP